MAAERSTSVVGGRPVRLGPAGRHPGSRHGIRSPPEARPPARRLGNGRIPGRRRIARRNPGRRRGAAATLRAHAGRRGHAPCEREAPVGPQAQRAARVGHRWVGGGEGSVPEGKASTVRGCAAAARPEGTLMEGRRARPRRPRPRLRGARALQRTPTAASTAR